MPAWRGARLPSAARLRAQPVGRKVPRLPGRAARANGYAARAVQGRAAVRLPSEHRLCRAVGTVGPRRDAAGDCVLKLGCMPGRKRATGEAMGLPRLIFLRLARRHLPTWEEPHPPMFHRYLIARDVGLDFEWLHQIDQMTLYTPTQ